MATDRGPLALVVALLTAAASGAAWHWSGPVEPVLRDRWRATAQLPGGVLREDVMDIARSGEVSLERRWRSTGRFETFEWSWRVIAGDGTVHAGTWTQPTPGRVRFAGGFPFDGDTWEREVLPQGGGPLAGRWRDAGDDAAANDRAAFVIDPDGNYRYTRVAESRATLEARAGKWRLAPLDGEVQSGQYRTGPDGGLIVSTGGDDVRWERY